MRSKGLLAGFLLGGGLCFLTVLGHGKVDKRLYKEKTSAMHFSLLDARATYIMHNPTSFLKVLIGHDSDGETFREFFPKDVDTKGKIYVMVIDNRGVFSDKSATALLNQFKETLGLVYSFIEGNQDQARIHRVSLKTH